MTITYHPEVVQGSEEWISIRKGTITASEMSKLLTPTLKIASNTNQRAHFYELLAQRISGRVEPQYVSFDMLRGSEEEILARALYAEIYAPVQEVGFVTNDEFGFTIGYSPDGLVGDDGLIECKSRRQRFQIETILSGEMDADFMLQAQTGLLVTRRQWLDFLSFSNGLPMIAIRVMPDSEVQNAIVLAATRLEDDLALAKADYERKLTSTHRRLTPTEWRDTSSDITV